MWEYEVENEEYSAAARSLAVHFTFSSFIMKLISFDFQKRKHTEYKDTLWISEGWTFVAGPSRNPSSWFGESWKPAVYSGTKTRRKSRLISNRLKIIGRISTLWGKKARSAGKISPKLQLRVVRNWCVHDASLEHSGILPSEKMHWSRREIPQWIIRENILTRVFPDVHIHKSSLPAESPGEPRSQVNCMTYASL